MKIRQPIVVACLAFAFGTVIVRAVPGPQASGDETSTLRATVPDDFVEHSGQGISVRTPAAWEDVPAIAGATPKAVHLIGPMPEHPSFSVIVVPSDPGQTLADTIKQVPADLRSRHADFKLLTGEVVQINGRDVARLGYSFAASNGVPVCTAQFIWLEGKTEYILTCGVRAEYYDALQPTIEEMAVSMRLPADAPASQPAANAATDMGPVTELNATVPDTFVERQAGPVTLRTPATWKKGDGELNPGVTLALKTDASNADFAVLTRPQSVGQTIGSTLPAEAAYLTSHYRELRVTARNLVRIGDITAARLTFQGKIDTGDIAGGSVITFLSNGTQYQLFYVGPLSQLDSMQPVLEQVAASTRIADAPAPAPTPAVTLAPTSEARSNPSTATPRPTGATASFFQRGRTAAVQPSSGFPIPTRPNQPPTAEETAEQLKLIETTWQKHDGTVTQLLPTMTGPHESDDGGMVLLDRGQTLVTPVKFTPPVTFRVVALCDGNDVRLRYAWNDLIFNWEMRPTELRMDGGPLASKHKPGAGALAANRWTGIEIQVTQTECVIWVDGVERYRQAGDLSAVNAPFTITPHTGSLRVQAVDVVR